MRKFAGREKKLMRKKEKGAKLQSHGENVEAGTRKPERKETNMTGQERSADSDG